MKTLNFRTRIESWEAQANARRYNPAIEAVWRAFRKDYCVTLGCGSSDAIYAYREGNDAIFLTFNVPLDYCGVIVYDMATGYTEEMFWQGQEQMEEVLGPRALDLTPSTIARRLYHHVVYS